MSEMCSCNCEDCGNSWEESRESIESDVLKCGSTDIFIEEMDLPDEIDELYNKFIGKSILDPNLVGVIPPKVLEVEFKKGKGYFTMGFNCENDIEAIDTCEKLVMKDIAHEEFVSSNFMMDYNVRKMKEEMDVDEFEEALKEAMGLE